MDFFSQFWQSSHTTLIGNVPLNTLLVCAYVILSYAGALYLKFKSSNRFITYPMVVLAPIMMPIFGVIMLCVIAVGNSITSVANLTAANYGTIACFVFVQLLLIIPHTPQPLWSAFSGDTDLGISWNHVGQYLTVIIASLGILYFKLVKWRQRPKLEQTFMALILVVSLSMLLDLLISQAIQSWTSLLYIAMGYATGFAINKWSCSIS